MNTSKRSEVLRKTLLDYAEFYEWVEEIQHYDARFFSEYFYFQTLAEKLLTKMKSKVTLALLEAYAFEVKSSPTILFTRQDYKAIAESLGYEFN